MASVEEERKRMDQALDDQQRWWGLEVTGWLILAFTTIPAVFVVVGLRSGSLFWLFCTAIMGLIGLGLSGTAAVKRLRAEEVFNRLGEGIRRRVGVSPAESEPPRESESESDERPRAA